MPEEKRIIRRRPQVGYSLSPRTIRLVEQLSKQMELPKGGIVDRAVEEYAERRLGEGGKP